MVQDETEQKILRRTKSGLLPYEVSSQFLLLDGGPLHRQIYPLLPTRTSSKVAKRQKRVAEVATDRTTAATFTIKAGSITADVLGGP